MFPKISIKPILRTTSSKSLSSVLTHPYLEENCMYAYGQQTQVRCLGSETRQEIREAIWPILHQQMIDYFKNRSIWRTAVHLKAFPRPSYITDNLILEEGYIPGRVVDHGRVRDIVIKSWDIRPYAFDEKEAHLSFHFKSRLFYLRLQNTVERVVVQSCKSDTVESKLFDITFKRHVPGYPTLVEIPIVIVGLQGSFAYRKGLNTELAVPAVPCHILGEVIPPPFLLDMSLVRVRSGEIKTIYLNSIKDQLPSDRSVIFEPSINLLTFELAWVYTHGTLKLEERPDDWIDPNFLDRRGTLIQLSNTGKIPTVGGSLKKTKKQSRGAK